MKVRIKLEIDERKIDEIFEASSVEDLIKAAQSRVAKELGWKGLFVRALTPLQFAQEAVKQYNVAHTTNVPLPSSLEDFIEFGKGTGHLIVVDS